MIYETVKKAPTYAWDLVKGASTTTYRLARTPFVIPTSLRKASGGIESFLGVREDTSSAKQYGYGTGMGAGLLLLAGEIGLSMEFADYLTYEFPVWYMVLAGTNLIDAVYEIPKAVKAVGLARSAKKEKTLDETVDRIGRT
jgi:hypothetical protein